MLQLIFFERRKRNFFPVRYFCNICNIGLRKNNCYSMTFENVTVHGKMSWRTDSKSVHTYGCRDHGYSPWAWLPSTVLAIGLHSSRTLSRCCIKMPAFNFEVMGNSSVYFSSWYVKMCSISSCGVVAIAQSDKLEWLIKSLNTLARCFLQKMPLRFRTGNLPQCIDSPSNCHTGHHSGVLINFYPLKACGNPCMMNWHSVYHTPLDV